MSTRTWAMLASSKIEFRGDTCLVQCGLREKPEAVFRITPPEPMKPWINTFDRAALESGIEGGFAPEELQKGIDALDREWKYTPPVPERWERI